MPHSTIPSISTSAGATANGSQGVPPTRSIRRSPSTCTDTRDSRVWHRPRGSSDRASQYHTRPRDESFARPLRKNAILTLDLRVLVHLGGCGFHAEPGFVRHSQAGALIEAERLGDVIVRGQSIGGIGGVLKVAGAGHQMEHCRLADAPFAPSADED